MNDATGSRFEIDGGAWQSAERARILRMQADWCIGMAAKATDSELFRAYVAAATACQQQALSIESGVGEGGSGESGLGPGYGPINGAITGVPT